MKRSRPYLLPLLALLLAVPVFAGNQDQLKCGVNQDRVWVYENLTSFDVGARLKCGESIEIVSRVKGYAKIRSASGTEGYVPDSALPDLPPLPDPDDKIVAATGPARSTNAGGTSLAAAARTARAAGDKSVSSASIAANPAPPTPSSAAVRAASLEPYVTEQRAPEQHVTVVSAQPPVAIPAPVAPSVPATPARVAIPIPEAAPTSAPVPAHAPAPAVAVAAVAALPSALAPPATASTVPISTAAPEPTTASAPAKQAPAKSTKHSKPAPAVAPSTPPLMATAKTSSAPISVASLPAPASPTSAPAPAPPAISYPVHDVVSPSHAAAVKTAKVKMASDKTEEVPIGAEYPDTQPENESADPACHTFFSAYGLSPSQFKWLAANRQKLYPSICPAPNVASVDFVILFTHDSDTYNAAMPTPVHTDRAGFSDFNPLTTIDTALISGPDADRARREYVWIFKMTRGGFDPVKFSPRRRPQFSTESKGSARAIEDALNYLQQQRTPLEANEQSSR